MAGELHVEIGKPSLKRRPCEVIAAMDGDTYRFLSVKINPDTPPTND